MWVYGTLKRLKGTRGRCTAQEPFDWLSLQEDSSLKHLFTLYITLLDLQISLILSILVLLRYSLTMTQELPGMQSCSLILVVCSKRQNALKELDFTDGIDCSHLIKFVIKIKLNFN